MRLKIERHGLRSGQRLHRFDRRVFVRAILVNDRDGAFPVGVEDEPGVRIEGGRIHVIADRLGSEHLPCVRAHDRHHLAATDEKHAPVRTVHCHTGR